MVKNCQAVMKQNDQTINKLNSNLREKETKVGELKSKVEMLQDDSQHLRHLQKQANENIASLGMCINK